MAVDRIQITEMEARRLPLSEAGQYVVRDNELTGFFVVVGRKKKTYTVQSEVWSEGKRKTVKTAIGIVGQISAKDARREAKAALASIVTGEFAESEHVEEAQASESRGVTLREAWERYRVALVRKNRSEGTIAGYRDHVERIFKAWADKPLRDLGEDWDLVARQHEAITEENGPYIANGAMRTLRAIYNHAWKKDRTLPPGNPCDAVDWNNEERRSTGMGVRALGPWFEELAALENPVRREFHLMTLLSGSRPGALKRAEHKHVDFERRVLHIPAPKGGAQRAFDIPLSRAMIRCLVRATRLSRRMYPRQGRKWIFAGDSASGHIAETQEDRATLSKWGNDLRQSYRTLAQVARVGSVDIKLLMNHALPGVNEDYITIGELMEDHLRRQQEQISKVILDAVRSSRGRHRSAILHWLTHASILDSIIPKDGEEGLRQAA